MIYYNRLTPDFYLIRNDSVNPFFSILSDDLPDEDDVKKLIAKVINHDYSDEGLDAATILDALYAFKCGDVMLFAFSSTPQKHFYYRFSDKQMFTLSMKTPPFYGVKHGAIGVYDGCFVSDRQPLDDGDLSLVLYKFNDQ